MDADPTGSYQICVSDIENFKLVNTIYGEEMGDKILKYLANYFSQKTTDGVCGRYSGDQFIVLARENELHSWGWVDEMIKDITIHAPVPNLNIKLGFYNHIDTSLSITDICDHAILAVKSVKHDYQQPYGIYGGEISRDHYMAQFYEAHFHEAIERKEFVIWYQPKYNPYSGQISGAEALVLWKTGEGSILQPGKFLPVFEKDGLIGRLDEYVFEEVCAFQKKQMDAGIPVMPISVNLSRNSLFQRDVVEKYYFLTQKYGISPLYVPIEITESAAVISEDVKTVAEAFVRLGFELHMDDFGSDRSSLSSLNVLPFKVVKIDKSLIDFIGDPRGDKILKRAMELMEDLGYEIVAEGVENEKQRIFLMKNGCDFIQGYYYSRPLPAEELLNLLSI